MTAAERILEQREEQPRDRVADEQGREEMTMPKSKHKFPKEILVTCEEDDVAEVECLVVHADASSIASPGDMIPTARYQLVEVGFVVAKAEYVTE